MAFLHGPEVIELEDQPRPVTVVRSSVIFLVGTAVQGPVNQNVLIPGAPVLGAQTFGDVSMGGTIPRALDGIFDVHGAVVIVCNVLDPDNDDHLTDVAAAVLPIGRRKQVVTPHRGVQPSTLVVKKADGSGAAYVAGTDYTYDAPTGVIQILNGGSIPADATSLSVAYTRLDPDKVTIDDIIGGPTEDGFYKGLWNCIAAESDVGFAPKVLIAPWFTDLPGDVPGAANAAVAEFLGLAERLRAVIIKDSDGATDAKAIQDRDNWGSRRVYCVGPRVLVRRPGGTVAEPVSPRVAGLISKVHAEKGFWWSPSNQLVGAGVVGISRPILFALGDQNSQANLLNEKEVAVVVRHEGFRLWGNRTCSDDPKYAFLSVVITNDVVAESLLRSHLWAIDRCMDKRYFELVPEGVNSFLATLEIQGAILGGECWVVAELNSVDSITQGHAWFDYEFTPPYPAERVTFRAHMSGRYIASIIPIASRAVLDPSVAA